MAVVQAACTIGASRRGRTNIVLRMPSMRTNERASYRAASTTCVVGTRNRASADRYTEAGSVPCSPTRSSATSSGVPARAAAAR